MIILIYKSSIIVHKRLSQSPGSPGHLRDTPVRLSRPRCFRPWRSVFWQTVNPTAKGSVDSARGHCRDLDGDCRKPQTAADRPPSWPRRRNGPQLELLADAAFGFAARAIFVERTGVVSGVAQRGDDES